MSRFDLGILEARFNAQADEILNALVGQRTGGALEPQIADYALVALQDAWSRFVRDLIIRSALGNATTTAGVRIPPGTNGVLTQRAALSLLRARWAKKAKPAWWEPYWYRTSEAAAAVTILAPRNGGNVMAAIGSSTNPIDDLRAVRNFAVHRLPSTAAEANVINANNKAGSWRQPCDIISATAQGGLAGEALFDSWRRRLSVVAAAAVK
jgi:hypothetical protein